MQLCQHPCRIVVQNNTSSVQATQDVRALALGGSLESSCLQYCQRRRVVEAAMQASHCAVGITHVLAVCRPSRAIDNAAKAIATGNKLLALKNTRPGSRNSATTATSGPGMASVSLGNRGDLYINGFYGADGLDSANSSTQRRRNLERPMARLSRTVTHGT